MVTAIGYLLSSRVDVVIIIFVNIFFWCRFCRITNPLGRQKRFSLLRMHHALVAGASPQTPLGELTALLQTP